MNALDLETPGLYVDLDVLERNIRGLQARCRGWGVGLRPHAKTHKIPEIARMQLDAGAVGLTVAKIGEAEVLPGDDVLIAFPVLGDKLGRLRALSRTRRVTVVVDSIEAARGLPGIPTLVDVDVGFRRCGVQSAAEAVAVARACTDFQGVFYYPAWLDDANFREAGRRIDEATAALEAEGFGIRIVSGGSTPGASRTPLIPRTTEIRPGTYAFNDVNCLAGGLCTEADCALRVLVTVVSTAVPGQCIVDGGSKTFSSDATRGSGTYGRFVGLDWTMHLLTEEHGWVRLGEGRRAKVGEKVWVIPSHVCPAVNLHDEIWYGRGGLVEGSWRVAARGRVR